MCKIKQNVIAREIESILMALFMKGSEHTKMRLKVMDRDLMLDFQKN